MNEPMKPAPPVTRTREPRSSTLMLYPCGCAQQPNGRPLRTVPVGFDGVMQSISIGIQRSDARGKDAVVTFPSKARCGSSVRAARRAMTLLMTLQEDRDDDDHAGIARSRLGH